MDSRLNLFLEAEKRGILPPDKIAVLTEARKRGLVNPVEQPSSWTQTMQERGADLADVVNRYKTGEQTLPETIFQAGMKSTAGAAGDVMGEAIKPVASAVIPDVIKEDFALAGKEFAQTDTFKNLMSKWNSLSDAQKADLEAAGLLPIGWLARMGGKAVAPVVKNVVNVAEDAASKVIPTPKVLPKEFESFQPLIEAKGWTMFSKTPNDLEVGKKVNNAISQEYEVALTKQKASEQMLRSSAKDIEAPDFIPQVQKSLKQITAKIAPESDDGRALKVLRKVIAQEGGKKAPSTDVFGVPSSPATINSNFALNIRQAINEISNSKTFPTRSKNALLKIKGMADDILDKEAAANPEFGTKWGEYKAHSTDVASRFSNNDSLKKFWQPEDYVTYKAAKNNPELSMFNDASLTRANKTLANLNTKNTGEVKAVIDALPDDVAKDVMRKAVIKANKEKISLTNALLQIHNPGSALRTATQALVKSSPAKEVPINKLIEDVEKSKIRK